MKNNDMIKTAKTVYSIVSVLQKLMIAAFIIILIGAVLLLFGMRVNAPVAYNSISFGNVTLRLSEAYAPSGMVGFPAILVTMAAATVTVGVIWYGLGILKQILRPMKEGRPFDVSVADGIHKLGVVVLAGGLIRYATEFITDFMFRQRYDLLRSLFAEGAVEKFQVNYRFSLDFLFAALLLFLLSTIFRYGEELQRQSDETL